MPEGACADPFARRRDWSQVRLSHHSEEHHWSVSDPTALSHDEATARGGYWWQCDHFGILGLASVNWANRGENSLYVFATSRASNCPTSFFVFLLLALWLDPTRTTHSYSLHDPLDETHLRLLVLTQNPKELQKIKAPIKENEQEMWWLYQMQRNKWSDFSPENNYSKFEKVSLTLLVLFSRLIC